MSRVQLSENFFLDEFQCPCCKIGRPLLELVHLLQSIRYEWGEVTVTSGARCTKHNREVGGSANSLHIPGPDGEFRAVDINIKSISTWDMYDEVNVILQANYPHYRMGLYPSKRIIHLDNKEFTSEWERWIWIRGVYVPMKTFMNNIHMFIETEQIQRMVSQ